MMKISIQGFPRIGEHRELKFAIENYWSGKVGQEELFEVAAQIRQTNSDFLSEQGVDFIPCCDFSLYDRMLDIALTFGVIPERFMHLKEELSSLDFYFAMSRGLSFEGENIHALDMTKWFNTNYHYLVPELNDNQEYKLNSQVLLPLVAESVKNGIQPVPTIIGPLTFLMLSTKSEDFDIATHLLKISDEYAKLMCEFEKSGVECVQIEEPILVTDRSETVASLLKTAYDRISASSSVKLIVQTYFDSLENNMQTLLDLPVYGVGIDFVHAPENLEILKKSTIPKGVKIFAGVVDGRNIWSADFEKIDGILTELFELVTPENAVISSSCSLLHCPVTTANEKRLPAGSAEYLSFAREKICELATLKELYSGKPETRRSRLEQLSQKRRRFLKDSARFNDATRKRVETFDKLAIKRTTPFADRIKKQNTKLNLPLLPTTTIGSFPQTIEVRRLRLAYKKGEISQEEYDNRIKGMIKNIIALQEELDIDVLVHGEFERNDMVEYFGEQLDGFIFTSNGWVQSYGSRCVKPPLIFGDVQRKHPMTVKTIKYAQSLTQKPVKGMLTGPVTILNWSFVRDDMPRSEVCAQIAFAIRDETLDLEEAGIKVIQVDEAALREGMPLRKRKARAYLDQAIKCFYITVNSVSASTQIHTHMCYSEFNEIIDDIIRMDADVITIENSRSDNELLKVFRDVEYPNQIGPGVYDIHSPIIPREDELREKISSILKVLSREKVWINPDCGLKTRKPEEVIPALKAMVDAAKSFR